MSFVLTRIARFAVSWAGSRRVTSGTKFTLFNDFFVTFTIVGLADVLVD